MKKAALLALLVVTGGLAGCIGSDEAPEGLEADVSDEPDANLSEARFDVLDVEVVGLETDDGTVLHNAVYRPDTDEPVPVFINFSPYWGDTATERGDNFAQYMIEEYVPRGYAVVLAAIRGTGHSAGCFQIGSDTELADLKATVEHFAGVDWSNGNVIAGGKSYDSTPQNGMLAKDAPEGLAGLFHVSGITDMYRYTYRHGVPYSHGAIFNTYYYGQGVNEYGLAGAGSASHEDEDADSLARAVDDAACPELPEMQANGVGTAVAGMKTDYWIERDWNRYVADSGWNGSIFFVHGLRDWNVKPDHILPWLDQLPDSVDVKGWLHQDVEDGTGHVYPMRADWNRTMLAWLDQVGKGKDTGVEHTFEVEGDDGVWRISETWPPRDADARAVGLDGATAETSDAGVETVRGPLALDSNASVRYAGQPVVRANVTVDANSDPVFTAVLYEEGPDGELTWVNEGVMRGLFRDGLDQPDPVPQGETVEVEIPMYPQDDVLEPDREWVLALGETPRFTQTTAADLRGVDYPDDGGTVHLPAASLDTALETQPEPIGCFAC